MSKPKVLVAIPAYNCEKQIVRVIRDFDDALLDRLWRVMVIDNRSKDGTLQAATEAAKQWPGKVEVFQNDRNYGLGGSHKVAFLRAESEGCDYVAILHGDHQAKTSELNRLLDEAERQPDAAAIMGSRFMRQSTLEGYSMVRTVGNVGINALYSVVSGRMTKDLGSGLNLYRVKDLTDHRFLGFTDTLNFNHDLLLDYYRKRSKLVFVPISWSETDQISNAKSFNLGYGAVKRLMSWRFGMEEVALHTPAEYTSQRIAG